MCSVLAPGEIRAPRHSFHRTPLAPGSLKSLGLGLGQRRAVGLAGEAGDETLGEDDDVLDAE